jgi:hypothetical protein
MLGSRLPLSVAIVPMSSRSPPASNGVSRRQSSCGDCRRRKLAGACPAACRCWRRWLSERERQAGTRFLIRNLAALAWLRKGRNFQRKVNVMKLAIVIGMTLGVVGTAVAQQPAPAPPVVISPTISSLLKDGYEMAGTAVGSTLSVFLKKGNILVYCESASGGGAVSRTTRCIPVE